MPPVMICTHPSWTPPSWPLSSTAIVNIFFGEAPYGATQRCTGWGGERMRAVALGPSVEIPMGPRSA
eukprot:4096855-Pyramimonas_sp.AAC.1